MSDRDFILQCLVPLTQADAALSEYELYCRINYGVELNISVSGIKVKSENMTYILSSEAGIEEAKGNGRMKIFMAYELGTIRVIYNKFIEVAKRRT